MKENPTQEQLQVILTGIFGDGCLTKRNNVNDVVYYYTSNCRFKEYLEYKQHLLGDMANSITYTENNGYSQTPIYSLTSKKFSFIEEIRNNNIETNLSLLDELGIALWFYDDGSVHKKNRFYNLNTHYFSEDIQRQSFIPFFNKLGIYPSIAYDRKKDGRVFTYLRIDIHNGAFEINNILRKYPIACYSYKLWPEEYYQKYKEMKERGLSKEQIKFEIRSQVSRSRGKK